jgi:hypothetical protein
MKDYSLILYNSATNITVLYRNYLLVQQNGGTIERRERWHCSTSSNPNGNGQALQHA